MVLIYSDTAMLVDLLFIQAKQTELGRRLVLLPLPSLLKNPLPLLQVSAAIIAAKTLCVFLDPYHAHLLHLLLRMTQKSVRAACKSTLKLPADKMLQAARLKDGLKRYI